MSYVCGKSTCRLRTVLRFPLNGVQGGALEVVLVRCRGLTFVVVHPRMLALSIEKSGFAFSIMVVLSVMFPVANTLSSLVKEKELRIKEGLKMMGLTGLAHTASWVVHFTCLFFFVSLFMVGASGTLFENRQAVPSFFFAALSLSLSLNMFGFGAGALHGG